MVNTRDMSRRHLSCNAHDSMWCTLKYSWDQLIQRGMPPENPLSGCQSKTLGSLKLWTSFYYFLNFIILSTTFMDFRSHFVFVAVNIKNRLRTKVCWGLLIKMYKYTIHTLHCPLLPSRTMGYRVALSPEFCQVMQKSTECISNNAHMHHVTWLNYQMLL